MKRRAIIFGVHPWGGSFRLGAHQIALALSRADFDVLYVAPPLSPPHILAAAASPNIRSRWGEYFKPPRPNGVRVLTPFTALPLSARWGADQIKNLRHWPRYTFPSLHAEIKRLGFHKPDIALIDGPLHLAAAQMVEPRKMVLRVFDRFSHMPGMTPALMRNAEAAALTADLVVYTASVLEGDVAALGARRTFFMPNGVDAAHFSAARPEPAAYADIPRARVVYVGQTGSLFDAALIGEVAAARPHINFIIIGPPSPALARLSALRNVHALGPVSWEDLPAYLQHADAGLAPFAVNQFRQYADAVNPLKIYEYLASGLPVVATRWAELERIGAPGLRLADPIAFGSALQEALDEPADAEAFKAYAAGVSWDKRVADLLVALDSNAAHALPEDAVG